MPRLTSVAKPYFVRKAYMENVLRGPTGVIAAYGDREWVTAEIYASALNAAYYLGINSAFSDKSFVGPAYVADFLTDMDPCWAVRGPCGYVFTGYRYRNGAEPRVYQLNLAFALGRANALLCTKQPPALPINDD